MLNDTYKIFKSGTDIRGIASEGVEGEHINLTDEIVAAMADGFILHAVKITGKPASELTVSVGRDCRISGERIAGIVLGRLVRAGVHAYDCSLSSTPWRRSPKRSLSSSTLRMATPPTPLTVVPPRR